MKPSQLLLSYSEFEDCIKELAVMDRAVHDPRRQWLCAWQRHDMAMSPRDDQERAWERLGHSCGWFAAMGTPTQTRLAPCPRCGKAPALDLTGEYSPFIKCFHCGTRGPNADTEVEAIQRWNQLKEDTVGGGRSPKDFQRDRGDTPDSLNY